MTTESDAIKNMLFVASDGQGIVETNYWETEMAQKGFCYLSWNAGAARLLVPESGNPYFAEMATAKYVVISRGDLDGRDGLEIMFEDDSDSPFFIVITTEMTDRLLPDTDQGGGIAFSAWSKDGKQFECEAKYRVVPTLPCQLEWTGV